MFRVIRIEKKIDHCLADKGKWYVLQIRSLFLIWCIKGYYTQSFQLWALMENDINTHFILIEFGVQVENKSEFYQKTWIFCLSEPNNKANAFSLVTVCFDVAEKQALFVLTSIQMEQQFLLWSKSPQELMYQEFCVVCLICLPDTEWQKVKSQTTNGAPSRSVLLITFETLKSG